ncbi:hypothetical protein KJI95_07235 [Shewanella sp. JM162201]|uniref:Uncharacterized protein n=1 Tax=Shewanella jiangmenensis TaxID=2837387 RepID=A0ABS5V1H4_9GAMM|nr:hypothetical protein [Shewanella jiangmenensis]MBT1444318.1 hypothetical protein [Shewanella jiangmenensis]
MAVAFLIMAVLLTLGWFGYSHYQANHWLQRHQRQRNGHAAHGKGVSEERALRSAPVYETLEEVALHASHNVSAHHGEHPFHCVAIVSDSDSCTAQKALGQKRFLSAEAPTLPLPNCDKAQCQCHYQHFEDRRVPGTDRRARYGLSDELYGHFGETNRRARSKGRRLSDH